MGNINVHKFNRKTMGIGGFVNISQNAKKAVFCGTLTAGGLKVAIQDGQVKIVNEGRFVKFVDRVPEVTFSGELAASQDKEVHYITERGVFRLTRQGIELYEIAPGIDLERDILAHMGFRPLISKDLRQMDPRLFQEAVMGLKETQFYAK